MLNSAEHEILNAHNNKNIKKFSFFGLDRHRMPFFLLINVVGILTFTRGDKEICGKML